MENRFNDEFYNTQENNSSEAFTDETIFDPDDSLTKKPEYPKKKNRSRNKAARITATALAFGLIAGSTFYGTNRVLTGTFGNGKAYGTVAKASDESSNALLSASQSGPIDTTGTTTSGAVADVAATALPSLVTISCTSVEEMQNMYEYFGRNGMPGLEDFFGKSGMFGNSNWSQFFGGNNSAGSGNSDGNGNSTGTASEQEVHSCGTGVIIGQNEEELLIATNDHVVSGATTLSVGFVDETAVTAEIKGTDPSTDLAIVSVKIADIPQETLNKIAVASIGNSEELSLGEQVVAIGNALGYGQSVTSGIISAFDRNLTLAGEGGGTIESTGLIQTDASINAGNSGGGLFNMKGELIAINEAKSSSSSGQASVDNMGFAIPMSKALPILQSLMNGEEITATPQGSNAYLGVKCSDVSEEASQMYGLPVGVSIVEVTDSSPAAEYGLKTGDVITEFNGQTIVCFEDLKAALSQCQAGETVSLTIFRSNEGEYNGHQISITLGEAPAEAELPETPLE